MEWQAIVTLVVIILLFIALCADKVPADISTVTAVVILWSVGILSGAQALAGFANGATVTVGALFIVIEAAQRVTWLTRMAKKAFGRSRNGPWSMFKQLVVVGCLSTFLNNTPLAVFFTPVVRDWAKANGFPASKFLIPLSYSIVVSGTFTIIGNSASLIIQGMLVEAGYPALGIFEPALMAVICSLVGFTFLCLIGYKYLLPDNKREQLKAGDTDADSVCTELLITADSKFVGKVVEESLLAWFGGLGKSLKLMRFVEEQGRTIEQHFESLDGWGNHTPHETYTSEPDASDSLMTPSEVEMQAIAGTSPRSTNFVRTPVPEPSASGTMESTLATRGGEDESKEQPIDNVTDAGVEGGAGGDGASVSFFGDYMYGVADPAVAEWSDYKTLSPVAPKEVFRRRDRLILNVDSVAFLDALEETPGMVLFDEKLQKPAPEFIQAYEIVLSETNPFIGEKASVAFRGMRERYQCAVLGIHRQNVTDLSSSGVPLSAAQLEGGDTVLVMAAPAFKKQWKENREFYAVSRLGDPRTRLKWWQYFAVLVLVALLGIGASGYVAIEHVSMAAAVVNVVFGFISAKDAYRSVQLDLLVLMAASLGIGKAMEVSGLAAEIGGALASLSMSPASLLYVIYFVVLGMCETISSNSAAALAYPIAMNVAKALQVNYMPFIMIIIFGSSYGFAVPISNQCHMIVMGPGGYNMGDFVKIGLIMDVLIGVTVAGLTPYFWPL